MEKFREGLEVNLFSAVELVALVLPHMRAQRWGRVISISSIYGREYGGSVDYMTGKAGLIAFSKHLALNLAPENVLVNCIAPGSIDFPGSTWDRFQTEQHTGGCGRFHLPQSAGGQIRMAGAHRGHGGIPGVRKSRPDHRYLPQCRRRPVPVAVIAVNSGPVSVGAPSRWRRCRPGSSPRIEAPAWRSVFWRGGPRGRGTR